MPQARQIQSVVHGVTNRMQSAGNSQTPTTPSSGGSFSREQKQKTVLFFSRLQLIYGNRFSIQWSDEKTLMLARREWAKEIDELSWPQIEKALERAKARLISGDGDFYWPDVGRILGLAKEASGAAQRLFPRALPEGEVTKQARKTAGRKGMAGIWSVMGGGHAG